MKIIEEVKVHKNKETQRFPCQVILREEGYIVLLYKSSTEGKIDDITVEKGSLTIAHYWTDRGYILWRMFDADKALTGTLFHICRDIEIADSRVTYLDMIVDIWIAPDGVIRVLDEDELEKCISDGLITQHEIDWIEAQKIIILKDYNQIINETIKIEKTSHLLSPDFASDMNPV